MSTRYVWTVHDIKTETLESREDVTLAINLQSTGQFYTFTGYDFSDGTLSLTNGKAVLNPTLGESFNEDSDRGVAWYNRSQKKYELPLYKTPRHDSSRSWWISTGYNQDDKLVTNLTYGDNNSSTNLYTFEAITLTQTTGPGANKGLSSSSSSSAHPNNNASGSNWYVYKGSDSIDPLSVTYSNDKPERGEAVMVQVNPAANTLGGTISYLYQYSTDGGKSWSTAGNATTETEKEIIVPENAEQFMARVRASDDLGFTSADYVSGSNAEVQTMKLWVGAEGKARPGKKLWVGVDGKARRVIRAWIGDENGRARRFF